MSEWHDLATFVECAGRYRGIILDLFGTLHDGEAPLEGAVEALQALSRHQIAVCLLSNSPRRRITVAARLEDMGITADLYRGLVTSGELAFEALSTSGHPICERLGQRCLHLGPSELACLLDDSGREQTQSLQAADFVLATGFPECKTLLDIEPVLRVARKRALVMICANPDKSVLIGSRWIDCAGMIADRYSELGGTVLHFGKPCQAPYDRALASLALTRDVVLAVGDSLHTDVLGANKAGIDAALVLSGIHHDVVIDAQTNDVVWDRLEALCTQYEAKPRYVLRSVAWSI